MTAPNKSGLLIGISACFMHPDPQRATFKGKTLLFFEKSLVHWVALQGAIPVLIPSFPDDAPHSLSDLTGMLDGLVLQGGADVAPETYGETAMRPEWKGDAIRDAYEIDLVKAFIGDQKPVLGICRGAQLINVALGGTLYQDIITQQPGAFLHRHWEVYDQNFHDVELVPGSRLSALFSGAAGGRVNSVHHQGVKDLGRDLVIEARSTTDGIAEAIRGTGASYVLGVQWHPEFQDPADNTLLDGRIFLREFLDQARVRKEPAGLKG